MSTASRQTILPLARHEVVMEGRGRGSHHGVIFTIPPTEFPAQVGPSAMGKLTGKGVGVGAGDRWIKPGYRELGDVYNTLNLPYVHT